MVPTNRWHCRLWRVGVVAVAVWALSGAGCGKLQPSRKPPPAPEPAARPEEPPKPQVNVQDVYETRLQTALAETPRFDRKAATKRMLKEKYQFDFDQFFPDGVRKADLLEAKDVQALLARKLAEAAESKFPAARRQQTEEAFAREFTLYKVGDQVNVTLKGQRKLSGRVEELGPTTVTIGGRVTPLSDLVQPPATCFNADEYAKAKRVYLNQRFEIERDDYQREVAPKLEAEVYASCAYLRHRNQWVRVDHLTQQVIEPAVAAQEAKYKAERAAAASEAVLSKMQAEGLDVSAVVAVKTEPGEPPAETGAPEGKTPPVP